MLNVLNGKDRYKIAAGSCQSTDIYKMQYESPEEKKYSSVCKAIHKSGNI